MEAIEGAVIVAGYVVDEEGMHICLQDGRVLIVAGVFALSLQRLSSGKLH